MKGTNTYIFINAWHAPADKAGFEVIKIACAVITSAFLTDNLREASFIIGLGPATSGYNPLGEMAPFLLVEDKNGDNFFIKREEAPSFLDN